MAAHFEEVAVIADVIAAAVFIQISAYLLLACYCRGHLKCFQDGATVRLPAADVVHLGRAGRVDKCLGKTRHVFAVDVVAHLLAFVAENAVPVPLEIALDQITAETVQFYTRMIRAGQAPSPQAAGGQREVTPVLLHQHVSCQLGGSKQ